MGSCKPFSEKSTVKSFHFTDETDIIDLSFSSSDSICSESDQHLCNENCLTIQISELLHPNYGMYVWPSAPVLAKFIWHSRKKLKNKVVLELGSGTGVVSVVAAKCGAHVIITDSQLYNGIFNVAEKNMKLNNIERKDYKIQELTWGHFSPFSIQSGNIDFILGSDVFYSPKDFEDIIVTVSYFLKKNANAEFWCSYEQRCSEWNIDLLLKKWDLTCEEIPLSSCGADRFNVAGCDLPGLKSIHLFVFRCSQ